MALSPADLDVVPFAELLLSGKYAPLEHEILSEETLERLAHEILLKGGAARITAGMLSHFASTAYDKNFDWNMGSLIQHFDPVLIVQEFTKFEKPFLLVDSMGLSWLFGELKVRSPAINQFLKEVLENSRNPESWWRAAFSLERLGEGDAVVALKHSLKRIGLKPLQQYLSSIYDKRSVVGILMHASRANIDSVIRPMIRAQLFSSEDTRTLINCAWLIGRLRLIDKEVFQKLQQLVYNSTNYELRYYVLFSIQENVNESFRGVLKDLTRNDDPLIRKMAVRGLGFLSDYSVLPDLERHLLEETSEAVIAEISQAIYALKNPDHRNKAMILRRSYEGENGLIIDEEDKWYGDPAIYDLFSDAEDPANVAFNVVNGRVRQENVEITNPVDLATGTGRTFMQMLQKMEYQGVLHGVDVNPKMCDFLQKKILRQRRFISDTAVICSSIIDLPSNLSNKSSFVVSSFGFPSRISNRDQTLKELKAVYEILSEEGVFVTIGWDETFNDELNAVWYRFVPDSIVAANFEDWREKRMASIQSSRNCGLSWYKRGLLVPLQFSSLKESAFVMGHLFGRDAAVEVVKTGRIEWNMSVGITWNTKQEIRAILEREGVLERD